MANIFITGSADGLGRLAATALVAQGHAVTLHARNEARGREALAAVPGAAGVLMADLASMDETRRLADDLNRLGTFDAILHNAGLYNAPGEALFAVNTLAPYILTCLVQPPKRLVYLSSDMHRGGVFRSELRAGNTLSYSDTKLQVLLLCKAVARRWPQVISNAVNPGWVPTKMGGAGAPDDLVKGYETQVWLAASNDAGALQSGRYLFHRQPAPCHPDADKVPLQEALLQSLASITGVSFPGATGS